MNFGNYGLRKTWFDICLKNPVSKDLLTSNMVNESKHFSHLSDSTATIFSDHFKGN